MPCGCTQVLLCCLQGICTDCAHCTGDAGGFRYLGPGPRECFFIARSAGCCSVPFQTSVVLVAGAAVFSVLPGLVRTCRYQLHTLCRYFSCCIARVQFEALDLGGHLVLLASGRGRFVCNHGPWLWQLPSSALLLPGSGMFLLLFAPPVLAVFLATF